MAKQNLKKPTITMGAGRVTFVFYDELGRESAKAEDTVLSKAESVSVERQDGVEKRDVESGNSAQPVASIVTGSTLQVTVNFSTNDEALFARLQGGKIEKNDNPINMTDRGTYIIGQDGKIVTTEKIVDAVIDLKDGTRLEKTESTPTGNQFKIGDNGKSLEFPNELKGAEIDVFITFEISEYERTSTTKMPVRPKFTMVHHFETLSVDKQHRYKYETIYKNLELDGDVSSNFSRDGGNKTLTFKGYEPAGCKTSTTTKREVPLDIC